MRPGLPAQRVGRGVSGRILARPQGRFLNQSEITEMINALKKYGQRAALVLPAAVAAGAAHAELPTEVTAAFTTMNSNVSDLSTPAWALLVTVTGGFVLMKLFKKFVNRAS